MFVKLVLFKKRKKQNKNADMDRNRFICITCNNLTVTHWPVLFSTAAVVLSSWGSVARSCCRTWSPWWKAVEQRALHCKEEKLEGRSKAMFLNGIKWHAAWKPMKRCTHVTSKYWINTHAHTELILEGLSGCYPLRSVVFCLHSNGFHHQVHDAQ